MSQPLNDAALDQLFRTARSYNGYLDKPVSTEQLHAIWDLFKFGPTSANILPSRIVWCTSEEAKAKLAATAGPQNGPKILSAPVTAIIAMDLDFPDHLPTLFPHVDARPWFADETVRQVTAMRNSSLQGGYFILAARALGLDTGPMSGFDNAAVDAAFFVDKPRVKSNFISTLGYGDPETIFDRLPRPDFDLFNTIA